MNPYEEPKSNLEKQPEARGGIQWLTIVQAVTIFLVISWLITYLPLFRHTDQTWSFVADNQFDLYAAVGIVMAPWLASTIFLASRVGYRWDLHAFIYSVTLALSVFACNGAQSVYSGQGFLANDPLKVACIYFAYSTFVTVIVIPVSRMILNFVRKTPNL